MKKVFRIVLVCCITTMFFQITFGGDEEPEEKTPFPVPCLDEYGTFSKFGSECTGMGLACIPNPCPNDTIDQ